MTPEEKAAFFARVDSSGSSVETLTLLRELHTTGPEMFSEQEVIAYTLSALSNLRRQAKAEGVWPRTAFLAYGLPVCLRVSNEEQTRFELYSLRQLLGEWINELPTVWAVSLIEECYSVLLPRLESSSDEELRVICWLIGDLGFRTEPLVDALEKIVRDNPGYSGDVALGTLVGLGNVGTNRERYLAVARERATSRFNNSLDFVLSSLIDATTVDFVFSAWIPRESNEPPSMEKIVGAITILGRIAKHTQDPQLQDRVVDLLQAVQSRFAKHLEHTLVIRGDILTNCDSESVIPFLYSLSTLEIPSDPKGEGALRLASLRLIGAVLPRQLRGCDSRPPELMLSKMRDLLFQSEDYAGRSMTHLNHLKEHVLDTLFKLGRPEIIDWFKDVLNAQKNPYAKSELLRLIASFSLKEFPPEIPAFIVESRELKSGPDEPELLVRLAASRLVRSASSWEAFTLLLQPGLTYNNAVMLDTVEALADVSLALCDRGERKQEVIDSLFRHLNSASDPVVSSVCRALNALALNGHLDEGSIEPISKWIEQPSPDNRAFVKGLMIQALGVFPAANLPTGTLRLLERWAMEHNDWLGWRSIETLIRLQSSLSPELLAKIGLIRLDGEWSWSEAKSASIWSATFVVLLSEKNPLEFDRAVSNAVLAENWEASDRTVMGLVAIQQRTNSPVPKRVGEALIEKAKRRNRPNSADTAVISYLPLLCPSEFSAEAWPVVWMHWTDDARAQLAHAFGELKPPFVLDQIIRALSLLVSDAHFGVRRSAARSLSKLDSSTLSTMVRQAAESEFVEDRRRACEFLPWLEDSDLARALTQKLSDDVFGSIRELVEKFAEERERRRLALRYLSILSAQKEWSNENVLALSRYGQALSHLGDDETLESIDRLLARTDLPSHVRYWAIRLNKELENAWRGRKQKWPQPLSDAKGTIQTGSGRIRMEAFEAPIDFKLWCEVSSNLGGQLTWGGTALLRDTALPDNFVGADRTLVLQDGREIKIAIFGTLSVQNRIHVDFQGIGAYPGIISTH